MADWRDVIADKLAQREAAEAAREAAAMRHRLGVGRTFRTPGDLTLSLPETVSEIPPAAARGGRAVARGAAEVAHALMPTEAWQIPAAVLMPGAGALTAKALMKFGVPAAASAITAASGAIPAWARVGGIGAGIAATAGEAEGGAIDKIGKVTSKALKKAADEGYAGRMPAGVENAREGAAKILAAPAIGGKAPLFDYSRMHEVPDVPQFLLPRYDPPRGVSARTADLISDPKARAAVSEAIDRGVKAGAHQFYHNKPLLEAYQEELGPEAGAAAYRRYIDYVSATSVRSKVPENARNASYYYSMDRQGRVIPTWKESPGNPAPYGHLAQENQRRGAVEVQQGGWDVIKNPKPPSFAENLAGNLMPVTVDAHAVKLPAMSIRDPRWLLTSLKTAKDEPMIYPQRLVASGEVSMDEAVKRPAWWVGMPNPNEYAALERELWTPIARQKGLAPAQGQAGGWTGGGELTGNKSSTLENIDPFLKVYEDRVRHTAEQKGMTPRAVMRAQIRGEMPLLSIGGIGGIGTAGAIAPRVMPPAMSEIYAQDRLEQ